jgi:putative spermidine/putrescine transport system permease protein
MTESRASRILLRVGAGATLAFIYFPLVVIAVYAFNENISQTWPIEHYTTKWFGVAWHDPDVRDALLLSVKAAVAATVIALALGTLAALAVSRSRFFGRETISFLVILPIALPGIITGLALQATILNVLDPIGISFSIWTIVIGHATFCIVVLYNNAVARMRRVSGNLDEASMDLGADAWQTFRFVTFPQLRSALLAGALLAFALSFDEVVVTIFTSGAQQTLPIWMFTNFARPRELPVVNVVALFVIVASIVPVWLAQRLAGGSGLTSERPTQPAVAAAIEAEP